MIAVKERDRQGASIPKSARRWPRRSTLPRSRGPRRTGRPDRACGRESTADPNRCRGRRWVSPVLRVKQPPTGLIVANNLIVIGTLRAIREAGLRVPDDVAIVAIDDPPWAEIVDPPLTGIRPAGAEDGRDCDRSSSRPDRGRRAGAREDGAAARVPRSRLVRVAADGNGRRGATAYFNERGMPPARIELAHAV